MQELTLSAFRMFSKVNLDEIKKRYFRDENYMRAWIEAVNRLIVRWGQIRDSINQI